MKAIIVASILGIGILGGALFLIQSNVQENATALNNVSQDNVIIENGKQIIEIDARGGYTPRSSIAKAGLPTIVRFNTSGTFDCSASVRIPSLDIAQVLPQTGETDIDLGTPSLGPLSGSCGMGMYPFDITFVE